MSVADENDTCLQFRKVALRNRKPFFPFAICGEGKRGGDQMIIELSPEALGVELAEAGNRRRQSIREGDEGQWQARQRLAIVFDNAEKLDAAVSKAFRQLKSMPRTG